MRERWRSRLGLILSSSGAAIGLGLLWQFPFIMGKQGGGSFFLLYAFFTLFIGIPLFLAELLLGRIGQSGVVRIFSRLKSLEELHHPSCSTSCSSTEKLQTTSPWSWVGHGSLWIALGTLSYYCVIAGWGMSYSLSSLLQVGKGGTTLGHLAGTFDSLSTSLTLNLVWSSLFLLLTFIVVSRGIASGVEKWSSILMPLLVALLLLLCVVAVFMPGFKEGLSFAFSLGPVRRESVMFALGLSLFTMSVGQGQILTYGSYTSSSIFIARTAGIVGLMMLIMAALFCFMFYPFLFSFHLPANGGEGLVFSMMPLIFSQMVGGTFLCVLFFFLFTFTGFTTAIAFMEVVVADLMDRCSWDRRKASLIALALVWLLSLPVSVSHSGFLFPHWHLLFQRSYFDTIVFLVSNWGIPLVALGVSLTAGWGLSEKVCLREWKEGEGLFRLWRFLVRWVIPGAILCILIHSWVHA